MARARAAERRGIAPHRARGLTVGGHLTLMLAVLFVTLFGVALYQTSRDFGTARSDAGLDTEYQARVAARSLERSLADATVLAADTAAGPSTLGLIEAGTPHGGSCSLSGGGPGLFPQGDLHLVDRSGLLLCSSAARGVGRRHVRFDRMPWFAAASRRRPGSTVRVGPFVDPLTHKRSIAVAAPVAWHRGRPAGLVVYALPVDGIAGQMAATFGGRDHLVFDVTGTSSGDLLSTSEGRAAGPNVQAPDFRDPPSDAVAGVDGVLRRYRSAPATGTGFTVAAGIPEAATVADARQELWGHLRLTSFALAMALLLALVVNRRIGRPLRRLTSAVDQAGRAVTPETVAVTGPKEVRDLVERFNSMLAARTDVEDQLHRRAMFDELTGLPNRVVALDRITHGLERTRRQQGYVAVFSVNLDRFGLVNDSLGRDVGDRMLVQVAQRIKSVLRPDDTLARFHGDEFVVVCEGVGSPDEAGRIADRIADSMRRPVREGTVEATMSVSIGIALGRSGDDSAETLLRDADAARSRAKERGKARHEFFDRSMREGARNRLDLENELRRAIERDEFVLAYQPIVECRTDRILGAEALLRWQHPEKGLLLPGVFIDLAEETGLIVPLGMRALERACTQAATWNGRGHRVRVSVNLSPRQISEPGLETDVRSILRSTGLDPSLLCLEITETTLMRGEAAAEAVTRLRRLGTAISVDDFGTGYSSLAYLQRFSIDELKIDRAFVRDLGRESSASALVAAIVAMARALGLFVVAEGIEETSQLEAVRALGCDAAQGFLIMRPQPPEDLEPVLELGEASVAEAPALPGPARH